MRDKDGKEGFLKRSGRIKAQRKMKAHQATSKKWMFTISPK